jgi:hypothetical protein
MKSELREQIAAEISDKLVGEGTLDVIKDNVKKLTLWDIIKIIKMVIQMIKKLKK